MCEQIINFPRVKPLMMRGWSVKIDNNEGEGWRKLSGNIVKFLLKTSIVHYSEIILDIQHSFPLDKID